MNVKCWHCDNRKDGKKKSCVLLKPIANGKTRLAWQSLEPVSGRSFVWRTGERRPGLERRNLGKVKW